MGRERSLRSPAAEPGQHWEKGGPGAEEAAAAAADGEVPKVA